MYVKSILTHHNLHATENASSLKLQVRLSNCRFCSPDTDKLNKDKKDKYNTYTDFRKGYKHVLIPSYVTQVI